MSEKTKERIIIAIFAYVAISIVVGAVMLAVKIFNTFGFFGTIGLIIMVVFLARTIAQKRKERKVEKEE